MSNPFDILALELEQLGAAPERAAHRAAPAVLEVARAEWGAGQGPDGVPWAPKKDGSPALQGLPGEATAHADGSSIVLEVPDLYKVHQAGAPGHPARQVLPAPDDLPPAWERPVLDALAEEGLR